MTAEIKFSGKLAQDQIIKPYEGGYKIYYSADLKKQKEDLKKKARKRKRGKK